MHTKRERTRKAIIDASYKLFVKGGFTSITMKDICEAVDMSRGGLYSHFSSTKEIFEAVLLDISKIDEINFEKEISTGVSAVTILDKALALVREDMMHAEDSISLAMYEYATTCSTETMERLNRSGEEKWKTLIEYGINRGEFKKVNIDEIVNIILYSYQGVRMWNRIVTMSDTVYDSIISHIRKQLVK